jgi:DNA invertase Pin-like site-specific DNA recombinase
MAKAMVHMAVLFAEMERDIIRSRTRDTLAAGRESSSGDRGQRQTTWWPGVVRERLERKCRQRKAGAPGRSPPSS